MTDLDAMQLALDQARLAAADGEVPVGAVVLKDGVLIATGRNAPIHHHDPTAHAEIVALRAAALALGNYRLDGCELFVTLEPCTMCSGAMLHARLQRVVFAAADPKTGAAGSVLNVFSPPQLNHQTQLQQLPAGPVVDACAALLQDFFRRKRSGQRLARHPLREDALRTPDTRFEEAPWPPKYTSDLPALAGLRMHYLDTGPAGAATTFVCLHSRSGWSQQYHAMATALAAAGYRVLAPDLPGFGRSDKPKKESQHTTGWHRRVLLEWLERLDVRSAVLVLHNDEIGALAAALPVAVPHRFGGMLTLQPGTVAPQDAAPFPDEGHRAAVRAMARPGWVDSDAALVEAFWRARPQERRLQWPIPPGTEAAQRAIAAFG